MSNTNGGLSGVPPVRVSVALAWTFGLVLLAVAPALASRPAPCADPEQPFYLHDGSEQKRAVYWGSGADRQIIVFCIHAKPKLGYLQTPVHMISVIDDPEYPEPPVETAP